MHLPLPRILFLDACVLYPAQTRDLFMALALERWVRLKWSQQVQEEWIRNFLKNKSSKLKPEQVERVKAVPQTMLAALEFQEPLVQGYEVILEKIDLPDKNDRHVVAAAFWGGAEAILTYNNKDFPEEILGSWDLTVIHPDDYLCELAGDCIRQTSMPGTLLEILKKQRSKLKNPPLDVEAFLDSLSKAGLRELAGILASYRQHL
ncbi:PIN domain protein [Meiothermus luteus]|uniref:PIN domain protein n=1 Tax=Meiothermus luteus TaxID=2026184 RepID=A0A399EMU5_9DEIN|nr:PIN domain-containing protein [Meiothermus luteus]RIH84369.1 PIN domain protein [Meiothermus luteus]